MDDNRNMVDHESENNDDKNAGIKDQEQENDDLNLQNNKDDKDNDDSKAFPNRLQAVWLTLLALLIMAVSGLIVGIVLSIFGIDYIGEASSYLAVINALAEIVAFGGIVLFVMKDRGLDWNYIEGKNVRSIFFYLKLTILMIGLSIVVSELDNLIQRFLPMSDTYMELFQNFIDQNFLLVFFSLCIVAPIFEEIFFRGLLLRGFLKNLEHWTAIFFSAFLFAVIHMNIWQGIGAFFIGVVIGWTFYKTRSLAVVIFAHFVNNFLALMTAKYISIPGFSAPSETGFQPIWFTLAGVVMLITGILLIEKRNPGEESI
ncbi:MAG: CPBP family intramembrane glutamic endopeptidase [Halanaerobiales bacterium]